MGSVRRWVRRIILFGLLPLTLLLGAGVTGALLMRQQVQPFFGIGWKIPAKGGVDERLTLKVNGLDQFVSIRGQDRTAPVLVYLHGGPGGALSDVAPQFQKGWEDFFTVVNWDQRGAGRSPDNGTDPLSVPIMRDDAISVIEQVSSRLGQRKVVLVGSSWGTALGHEVVKARPDLIHAFVAIGVTTSWRGNFAETARLIEAHARNTNDQALLASVAAYGTPPDANPAFLDYVTRIQKDMASLGHSAYGLTGSEVGRFFLAAGLLSPHTTLADFLRAASGPSGPDIAQRMGRSLMDWDLQKSTGLAFQAPVVWVQGDHDWQTPTTLASAAFPGLCAPWKAYVPLHNSAHFVITEEPGRVLKVLLDFALPATRGEMPAGATAAACPPLPATPG